MPTNGLDCGISGRDERRLNQLALRNLKSKFPNLLIKSSGWCRANENERNKAIKVFYRNGIIN